MVYSSTALSILSALECGVIKSPANFWASYTSNYEYLHEIVENKLVVESSKKLVADLDSLGDDFGISCVFDNSFPAINRYVKNKSEKPFILYYRGDINLLKNIDNNVAVIGLTDPDEQIVQREIDVVERLVQSKMTIVSGLARGCDTVAHKACIERKGKTIAILPSQLDQVYPSENRRLADDIVASGGLLVTEYYGSAKSKYEAVKRFIERDRLQAMFSKAVILIASYIKGEGDSGSIYAMEAALKYRIKRYALYKKKLDYNNIKFGLNRYLINSEDINRTEMLCQSSFKNIALTDSHDLVETENTNKQLKLF